jgi:hypothetical protein
MTLRHLRNLAGVAAVLLILELLLILLEPVLPLGRYQYDAELGFRGRSHRNDTNRWGFNDRDHPPLPAPGIWRAVVLNDAAGWAGGRRGSYVALLEQRLEARYGQGRVELLNLGYPSIGPTYQLGLLRRHGLDQRPHLVLLGFSLGNDFLDSDPRVRRFMVNDVPLTLRDRREAILFGYPLLWRSRLLDLLSLPGRSWQGTDVSQNELPEEIFLALEWKRMDLVRTSAIDTERYRPHVTHALASVREMARLCRSHDIDFRVALYPDQYQVDASLRERLLAQRRVAESELDLDWPQRTLIAALEEENIPYVDLTPALRSSSVPLHRGTSTHWNEHGRARVAEELERFLVVSSASRRASRVAPMPAVNSIAGASGVLRDDWQPLRGGAWQWRNGRPLAELGPLRPHVTLRFTLPEKSLATRPRITLRAVVNGQSLAPETYDRAGDYAYSRPFAPAGSGPFEVQFAVDPPFAPGGADTRELGVIVWSVGVELR